MAEGAFDFKQFIEDSKNTLLNPKEYFTTMKKEGGFGDPIIKALIYGAIAGGLNFLWSVLGLTAIGGMFGGMIGGGVGIMLFVGAIIGAIIGLFIGAILILIVSAICGGSTDFETNTRISASLMVLSPISAALGFSSGLNIYLGAIASMVVSLFGVWLLFNALVNALAAKEGTAKIISIVLAIIPTLMLISTLMCASAVNKNLGNWQKQIQKSGKISPQDQKKAEDMMNNLLKKAKELDNK